MLTEALHLAARIVRQPPVLPSSGKLDKSPVGLDAVLLPNDGVVWLKSWE